MIELNDKWVQTMTRKHILLVCAAAVLVVRLRFSILPPLFLSNLGWLQLARAHSCLEARETWSTKALEQFHRVVATQRSNYVTLLGLGIAYAMAGDEFAALSSWRNAGVAPQVLIDFGHQAQADQRWDDALLYYKSATNLELGQPNESQFLAANICQLAFAQPDVLNQRNQAYCRDHLSQYGDNLIVNGQFNGGDMWGWGKRYFSSPASVVYRLDERTGQPAPAALIIGLTKDYHGGLFQRITLPSGATVRYSAWVKILTDKGTTVRLLYFGSQVDGKPVGSMLQNVSNDIEWTYFERVFQVPKADGMLFTFFPALLTGKGQVWIDDVRLELLPTGTDRN